MQIILISGIVRVILRRLNTIFNLNGRAQIWAWIPFILPPVLLTNLWPMRMSIYAFVEILFVVEMVYLKKQNKQLSLIRLCEICVFCIILSNWRSEGIYYIIAILATVVLLFGSEMKSNYKKIVLLIGCVAGSICFLLPQYYGTQKYNGDNYELTGILLPMVPLVNKAIQSGDQDEIEKIDRVLSVKELQRGYQDGYHGIQMYWNQKEYPIIKYGYSKSDYDEMKKAYIKLIIKHPYTFLNERMDTFKKTLPNGGPLTYGLYNDEREPVQRFIHEYTGTKPLNLRFRTMVTKLIEQKLKAIWNPVLPLIVLIATFIWLVCTRSKYFILSLAVSGRLILTFLTAPAYWFMYYYSWYIGGYVVLLCALIFINKRRRD